AVLLGRGGVARHEPSSFNRSRYALTSSRQSASPGSLNRTFTSQPSPYGSSLIFSGLSPSSLFTSTISPDSGANTSDTAFTDSISAYGWFALICLPGSGGSKNTISPSESCANQVTPKVAWSP